MGPPLAFKSNKAWVDHVSTEHGARAKQTADHQTADRFRRRLIPPISCPLCEYHCHKPDSKLDAHIAQHLHSFALLSLPSESWTNQNGYKESMGISDYRAILNFRSFSERMMKHTSPPADMPKPTNTPWIPSARSWSSSSEWPETFHYSGRPSSEAIKRWFNETSRDAPFNILGPKRDNSRDGLYHPL